MAKGRATAGGSRRAAHAHHGLPADYAALKDVTSSSRAMFEDRKVKADVIKKVQAVIGDKVTFGSNTSTLPITIRWLRRG